ncbi:hypothetical protein TrST_g4761 [Triparma strigata]|uniref:DUF155 domain-containing protein n=1 Tax=Triparma strigata TaxID=1606541 RepID=A0A9W7AUA7_9STRA|nr:hypothetical protein TrST_g4761 [Triparma strigata]
MSNQDQSYGSFNDVDDVYDTASDADDGGGTCLDEAQSLLNRTPPQLFQRTANANTNTSPHNHPSRRHNKSKHKSRTRKNRSRSMSDPYLSNNGEIFRRLSAYSAYANINLEIIIKSPSFSISDAMGGSWDKKVYGKDEVLHFYSRNMNGKGSVEGVEEDVGVNVFIFGYGCIVFWGWAKKEERKFIEFLGRAGGGAQKRTEEKMVTCSDSFLFIVGAPDPQALKIKNDKLYLSTSSPLLKLSLSFILAQSCNLFVFEDNLETTIADTRPYPESLKSSGRIGLSQNEIRKMMGRIYLERCETLLYSDVLDTPEYLWYDDRYETSYQEMKEYLDFSQRIQNLHTRMEVLDDLLQLLNTLADSSHASHLEWIIIWLIVIEVVVQIGWNIIVKDMDALGWFPNGDEAYE